jgi:hypothetical protein
MRAVRSLVIALLLLVVFYVSFDSGIGGSQPAPAGVTGALLVLTLIFGGGAWATNAAGDPKRSQMFTGVAAATGLYGLGRLLLG